MGMSHLLSVTFFKVRDQFFISPVLTEIGDIIETEHDLNLVITKEILSLGTDVFTVNTVRRALKAHHVNGRIPLVKGALKRRIKQYVQNLMEHGKVMEDSRVYRLVK